MYSFVVAKGPAGAAPKMDVLQGTLDLMVLQTLESMGPLHGYGIARRIEQISEDLLKLNEGTVYASLMRLQQQRWISASWGASENNRKAKFYAITKAGRRQLARGDRELGAHRGRHGAPPAPGGAGPDMWAGLVALVLVGSVSPGPAGAWTTRRGARFEAHLELLVERYIRSGMTPDEARAAARRQFGNVTLASRGDPPDERHRVDRRAGAGSPLRAAAASPQPRLRRVVVATLALGIGGTTAVFSVVQAVLLAPLPYEQPGQLVRFYQQEPGKPETRRYLTGAALHLLREHAASFTDVGARSTTTRETGLDLVRDGHGQRLRCCGHERLLPHAPLGAVRGPGFQTRADDEESGTRRVVLSDTVWRTHFAGDPSIIGTTIQLSAEPYEVAGIAPPGFDDPIAAMWTRGSLRPRGRHR